MKRKPLDSLDPEPPLTSRDFDGHQAWPLLRMSPEQRLSWAWEMFVIQREAAAARKNKQAPVNDSVDG